MPTEEKIDHGAEGPDRPRRRPRCLGAVLLVAATVVATVAGDTAADDMPAGAGAESCLQVLMGADALHELGVTGRGVTIAVISGGALPGPRALRAADGHDRLLAVFDAVSGSDLLPPRPPAGGSGHAAATGLLEVMLSSSRDAAGRYEGVAPNADLVLVRALGPDGTGRTDDIVRGIEWVVANRDRFGIRVLSLPLAPPPLGEGSLSRVVNDAWAAGIVVVVAADNGGPALAMVSSAVFSGFVALVLEASPWLTPDEAERRLRGITWSDKAIRGITWSD